MDHRFEELLLEYTRADSEPAELKRIEATLWREFGHTKAVFVMDMSGFSLLAQRYGIVHYLSMVKRMQLATAPIIEANRGAVVKFEADNCFAAFDAVEDAARAAIALNQKFAEMNASTEDHFDIRVSIGIDFGDVLLIGGPDYFGDSVNRASKLGEDVAGAGEVLITRTAFDRLPADSGLTGTSLELSISGIALEAVVLELAHRAPSER